MVPPVEYPALEAVDCMQLFSSIVISSLKNFGKIAIKVFHIVYDNMHEVIATPSPHPVLRPIYRLERDINPPKKLPIITALKVNCFTLSP